MSFGMGGRGPYKPKEGKDAPKKGNPWYRRGAAFERTFMRELAAGEYNLYTVRSAGSHGTLDILEIQLSEGEISVWGYQLKCGAKPSFSDAELGYLQFLEDSGVNVRIIWKQPHEGRETHTVDSARERFGPKSPAKKLPDTCRDPSG